MHRLTFATAAAAALAITAAATTATTASAAELEIELTGLDFAYDGTAIEDAGTVPVDGVPADRIDSADFYLDGVQIESLNTTDGDDMFVNFLIGGVTGLPESGGAVAGGGGFFNVAFDDLPLLGLGLDFGSSIIFYSGGEISVNATLTDVEAFYQNLPVPYAYDNDEPIFVTITGFITPGSLTTDANGTVTGFTASGTANIIGQTVVPEPAGLALIAPAGLLLLRRRRA